MLRDRVRPARAHLSPVRPRQSLPRRAQLQRRRPLCRLRLPVVASTPEGRECSRPSAHPASSGCVLPASRRGGSCAPALNTLCYPSAPSKQLKSVTLVAVVVEWCGMDGSAFDRLSRAFVTVGTRRGLL